MELIQGIFYKLPGTSFVYDPAKVEFLADKAQLKDLLIGSTFGALFTNNIDASWHEGVATGTGFGGAGVSGGKLDLAHNDVRGVDWDADLNADSQQTGCFRFLLIPNYNGTPANTMTYCLTTKANGNTTNGIFLMHNTSTSQIGLLCYDEINNIQINVDLGVWSPVISTEYEFELNYNFTTGATRLFIDGMQFGITQTTIFTRSADIGLLRIGSNSISSSASNFKIDNFIVFDEVQHTTDYTPTCNTKYCCEGVPIMVNSAIECDDIGELADLVHTTGGSDNVRFSFDVNGTQKYYSGGNWIDSDGTYAQSNNYADLTPVILATLLSTASRVKLIAFLYSADGSTTPTLTSIIVYYDFGVPDTPVVNRCIVHGWLSQSDNTKENLPVRATLHAKSLYNDEVVISPDTIETTTDSRGYWDLSLINNAEMQDGAYYDFELDGWNYARVVPNVVDIDFAELEIPTNE